MGRFDDDLGALSDVLVGKGYSVTVFDGAMDAADYLDGVIDHTTVGLGDSLTLSQLSLAQRLSSHNEVYDPQDATSNARFIETARQCLTTDVFLSSVNAISRTGEIVNIDGSGNRIAGSLFGHRKVYLVIGSNKVEDTLDAAIWRARNIAAPQNAKRLGLKTPCAKEGMRCFDCASPARICNCMAIHMRAMADSDMEIVLIDDELGL